MEHIPDRRMDVMKNPAIESLMAHRSVRKFKAKRIAPELLDLILRAGIRAATAGNLQLYSLVVVDDRERQRALQRQMVAEGVFKDEIQLDVPVEIIALVDQYRLRRWFEASDCAPVCNNRALNLFQGLSDAAIALQNIVVAAESLGLGTCYVGGIQSVNIQKLLNAPEHVFPAGMVCIGYPDESPELRRRLPLEAVVHRNTYRVPTDDEVRTFYREREGVWETVKEEIKERLRKENIHSIPQAVAVQRYSKEVVVGRSKGIVENLDRAKFVLTQEA
jgi:nitroreductase